MGILNKLFGKKKSFSSALTIAQENIFKIYGVDKPTDAQKVKALFYLCITGMAILHEAGGSYLQPTIDTLIKETKELTNPLVTKVGDLSNNAQQMRKILSAFPKEYKIGMSTQVDGFDALFSSIGQEIMKEILTRNGGPFGTPGSATIIISNNLFGEDKSSAHFMEVFLQIQTFYSSFSPLISDTLRGTHKNV